MEIQEVYLEVDKRCEDERCRDVEMVGLRRQRLG
jgi:hypothetical protein